MFIEKLNKKQNGVYVIEEEKVIIEGIWEGLLNHDNVNHQTIYIYTEPKIAGKRIENFFISTPSEAPWKTYIKVFANSEKIYIVYESSGDQVEADDINLLQDELVNEINRATTEEISIDKKLDDEINRSIGKDNKLDTRIDSEIIRSKAEEKRIDTKLDSEISRATSKENQIKTNLDNEIIRSTNKDNDIVSNLNAEISRSTNKDNSLEQLKANKSYVDTELLKKYDKEQVYTKEEVHRKIEDLIGSAPDALDTLVEIAEALNNDPNFAATITTELAKKVDKAPGKGLSDENYTAIEKSKLAGVAANANNYTHPNSHPASIITETTTKRFVSDTEKANWNAKETPAGAQAKATKALNDAKTYAYPATGGVVIGDVKANNLVAGSEISVGNNSVTADNERFKFKYNSSSGYLELWRYNSSGIWELSVVFPSRSGTGGLTVEGNSMATELFVNNKVKTDVPSGAKFTDTVYIHPSTHPPTIIAETASKRFVTDTEKATWNAKADKVDGKGFSDENYTLIEKNKLAGIAANANNYTHPNSHPASIITETTTKRFVSDTEKANWNAKETTVGAQAKATKALNDAKSYIEGLNYITNEDTRAVNSPPSFYGGRRVTYEFKQTSVLGLSGISYAWLSTYNPWSGHQASHITSQIAIIGRDIYTRQATSVTTWGPWSRIFTQGTPLTCNDLKGV